MAPNTPTFDRPPDIPLPAVTDDVGYLLKWFWVIKLEKFVHMDNPVGDQLTEKQFNEAFADIPLPRTGQGGRAAMSPSKYIREYNRDSRVVTFIDSVASALDPANGGGTGDLIWRDPSTGLKTLNIFQRPPSPPPGIKSDPEGLALLLDSLLYVCNSDEAIRHHLLQWITCLVFRPWVRINHGIIMGGESGTGKTTVGIILKVLLGQDAVGVPEPRELKDPKYNGYLLNKRLHVVEEIMEHDNYELYNKLKVLFTNERLSIRQLYQPVFEVENIGHLLMLTNHRFALTIEEGDRRIFAIWSDASAEDAKRKKAEGYFKKLYSFLVTARGTNEGVWVFRKYLEDHILPTLPEDFHLAQPPETQAHADSIQAAKHPVATWLEEKLYEGKYLFEPKMFFERGDLWDSMQDERSLSRVLQNAGQVKAQLAQFGYKELKRQSLWGHRMYCAYFDIDGWGDELSQLLDDKSKEGRDQLREHFVGPLLDL